MDQKPSPSNYDLLESKYASRSVDLIQWWTESENNMADYNIYMEEEFSSTRFVCVLLALLVTVGVGGGVYTSFKGSETPTQSWLSLTAILSSIILVGLAPVLTRKL
jgi:hypothetical protein